jgi:hypothetical protein
MTGFRRRIHYLGGYDPRGARFYHELLSSQVGRHAGKTGEAISVSPRVTRSTDRTDCSVVNSSACVEVDYTFLRWEDIVLKSWIRNPVELMVRAVRCYGRILRNMDLPEPERMNRRRLITLFYPALSVLLVPTFLATMFACVALTFLPWWGALASAILLAAFGSIPILKAVHASWLLRFFIFNDALSAGVKNGRLADRLNDFVDIIADDTDGYDEVILVTHSNGSILAVPVVARLLRRWGGSAPKNFRLVTLGQCIPLLACRKDAFAFRRELAEISQGDLRWFDIASPADGAALFGVNPLLLYSDHARPEVSLLSPRFHHFRDADTSRASWKRWYDVHFDYLRSGDRVSPLDLPSLVCQPLRIDEAVQLFQKIP